MSSAGRAGSSSGCVTRPKARGIGLHGFVVQIQLCLLIGSYVMATAEHREPYESRGSRTVLGARGGEIPPRDSPMVVTIGRHRMYLWRAVDDEGEVLDILVQSRRNKAAAVKLLRKLMKKLGFAPRLLVTDKLPSYGAAKAEIGMTAQHEKGLRKNNRAENSHQPVRRRERKMQ